MSTMVLAGSCPGTRIRTSLAIIGLHSVSQQCDPGNDDSAVGTRISTIQSIVVGLLQDCDTKMAFSFQSRDNILFRQICNLNDANVEKADEQPNFWPQYAVFSPYARIMLYEHR
ncbi:hypothetical protein BJX76DRAFT_182297 [Aspergillus varians]